MTCSLPWHMQRHVQPCCMHVLRGIKVWASPGLTPVVTLLQQHYLSCLKHHPRWQLCSLHLLLQVLMNNLHTRQTY